MLLKATIVVDGQANMSSIDAAVREQEVAGQGSPYIVATKFWRRERIATGCNFLIQPAMAKANYSTA